MSGRLILFAEPTDEYGCVKCELRMYPGGHISTAPYVPGSLYLRDIEFRPFVEALSDHWAFDVEVRSAQTNGSATEPERPRRSGDTEESRSA